MKLFCLCVLTYDNILLCNHSWPGTLYVDKAGPEPTETHLPLPLPFCVQASQCPGRTAVKETQTASAGKDEPEKHVHVIFRGQEVGGCEKGTMTEALPGSLPGHL